MKADMQATMAMRESGQFKDERSYVAGERMHPGTNHPCIYYFGEDVGPIRHRIYERDEHRCQLKIACDGTQELPSDGSLYERWHLEHAQGGIGQSRCWCDENMRGACYECHQIKDGRQPRFMVRSRAAD